MRYRYRFLVHSMWIVACLVLFHFFYQNAKDMAITDLNGRQMIHAKQAVKGINDYFDHWITNLSQAALSDSIVGLDDLGKYQMEILFRSHKTGVEGITRVDQDGKIIHTFPYSPKFIGADLSGQEHIKEIRRTHKPVLSSVFRALQGYRAIALYVPVFKGNEFQGGLGVLLDFESISRQFLQDIVIGKTGYAWVIDKDGIELYCPVAGHTGNSVLENCRNFPTVLSLVQDMVKGKEGVTTYSLSPARGSESASDKKHAVYLPVRIANTLWSIAVSTSEGEVLASLEHFRNQLIGVITVLLLGSLLFSYYAMKSWGIVREEKRRRSAESAMRESQARFHSLFMSMNEGMALHELVYDQSETPVDYIILEVNDAFERITGIRREAAIGRKASEVYGTRTAPYLEIYSKVARTQEPITFEVRFQPLQKDLLISCFSAQEGQFATVFEDITERKQAEAELRKSEERYRDLYDEAPVGYMELDAEGRISRINRKELEVLGYNAEEVLGRPMWEFVVEEKAEQVIKAKLSGEHPSSKGLERLYRRKDGSTVCVLIEDRIVYGENGGIKGIRSTIQDITERKRAEEKLAHSHDLMRYIIEHNRSAVAVHDRDLRYVYVSQRYLDDYRVKDRDIIGKHHYDVFPDLPQRWRDVHQKALAGEISRAEDDPYVREEGTVDWTRWECRPWYEADGSIGGIIVYTEVITEQKKAVDEMRASEEKFKAAFEGSHDAVLINMKNGKFLDCNQKALEMFGLTDKEAFGRRRPSDFAPEVQADGRDSHEAASRNVEKAVSERVAHFEFLHRRETGEIFPSEVTLTSYQLSGETVLQATIRDISDRKKTEEEREKLQAQLIQAQKMESVGRLAGGVAHDFNNMLGIIIGNAEMAALQVDHSDPVQLSLQEILKAASRSAGTVRQLLAFARKQIISPKILDMNDTVSEMLKMLQRLIGEDIDLAWLPGFELWRVKIDPSQVSQILINLAINARDAISGVGKVTIETDNVTFDESYCARHKGFVPGDYVLLAVSDNGTGMSKEVLEHLFEPFFTTKGVGKGTGLGLSTIYGIVKQNGGFISVYSELGQGTTFKIYLPRLESEPVEDKAEKEPEKLPKGTETVLLVEDEEAILRIGQSMLEGLGYKVLTAATPGEAIQMTKENREALDLLLTDVVMPEMNGRQLSDRLKAICPDLKCLYMSGYTADVIAHHGILDEKVIFIQKPFSIRDLALKIRETLDRDLRN